MVARPVSIDEPQGKGKIAIEMQSFIRARGFVLSQPAIARFLH